MKPFASRWLGAIVMCCALVSLQAQTVDKSQVLQQARDSYYRLSAHGFSGIQCNIRPDWEGLLSEQRKTDPASADHAIAMLKSLQFTVSVDSAGSAKVTHTTVAPENEDQAKRLQQVYGGMEQMITGFFATWTPFMMSSPFPEVASEYQLADQGSQWLLTYKEGNADVATTMAKDLVVRELKVTTPEFKSSILPQFDKGSQGLVLIGYKANYDGKTPAEKTVLDVKIANQEVNGLQIPAKLGLSGSYGGTTFAIEVSFFGCSATKK